MALSDDDYEYDEYLGKADFDGNQWKIAYADFTTSMMAILFVLWIIASADTQTREHLARYFNPIGVDFTETSGGMGLLGDETSMRGDIINLQNGDKDAQTSSSLVPIEVQTQDNISVHLKETMRSAGIDKYSENLNITATGNEVQIALQSSERFALFTSDHQMAPRLRAMLRGLAPVLTDVGRPFAIEAHAARPAAPVQSKKSLEKTQMWLVDIMNERPDLGVSSPIALQAFGDSRPVGLDSTHLLNDRIVIVIK